MGFFLMGYDVAYYVAVSDISFLGNLVYVDKETRVCYLDISDSLEYSFDLLLHVPCPFRFVRTLHRVPLILVLSSLWDNDHVHFSWLYCYFCFSFVRVYPGLSCSVYRVCG